MIEAPANSQKHDTLISHGAQMLASGRSASSVIDQLKKRGMSAADVEKHWGDIQSRGTELIRLRHRRVRVMGACWLSIGLVMLAGIGWVMIMYRAFPFILLIGVIPLAYGIYLFRVPPTQEPSIESPSIFGRNL